MRREKRMPKFHELRALLKQIFAAGRGPVPIIFSPLINKADFLALLKSEDDLASLERIESVSWGEAYKAELPGSNGKMFAINKVVLPSKDETGLIMKKIQFEITTAIQSEITTAIQSEITTAIQSEITTASQIRHMNILPLLAHVAKPDCHLLVYEFMKNGSLHNILKDVAEGKRDLDWPVRHRIALGIASGLEYLHFNHSVAIVHRDIKPSNVFLDDDMTAKIAGFGIAVAMPDAQTHIETSSAAGTLGYVAPECFHKLIVTRKCDIYSFGVLLAVLVIGKLPLDEFFSQTEEMNFVRWMSDILISENPIRAIDSKLLGNGYEEQMSLVLKIARLCTKDDPEERPTSTDVKYMLASIQH